MKTQIFSRTVLVHIIRLNPEAFYFMILRIQQKWRRNSRDFSSWAHHHSNVLQYIQHYVNVSQQWGYSHSLIWYSLASLTGSRSGLEDRPKVLISAPRSEERSPRSHEPRQQPSQKSSTGQYAPVLDISYWLDGRNTFSVSCETDNSWPWGLICYIIKNFPETFKFTLKISI